MSRPDDVRVGLIGGAGIICGAAMGAIVTIALVRREDRERRAPEPRGPGPLPKPPGLPVEPGAVGWDDRGPFYVVRAGDHGAKIAEHLGFPGDVPALVAANPELKGRWRSVQPGDRLRLPLAWTTGRPAGGNP
jgi:hypothetical protein